MVFGFVGKERSIHTRSLCRKPHFRDETTSHRDARWNVERVGPTQNFASTN